MDIPRPPPPLPPRGTSTPKVTFKGAQTWRESIAAFTALCIAISVFISVIVIGIYVWKDRAVYEELVDYLDKTITISKINYNPRLGFYKLKDKEGEALQRQRTYKTIIWCYLAAELGTFAFLSLILALYLSTNVSHGTPRVVFWVATVIGLVYVILEIHLVTFIVSPYSATLPETSEQLLNRAIPHNPGGLRQMEQRFGCSFDYDLYAVNQRTKNPKNTCDPYIHSSFIPRWLLFTLFAARLIAIVIGFLLFCKRTPVSETVAQAVEKLKPSDNRNRLYVKKQQDYRTEQSKKTTTFGASNRNVSTPLPPIPSPGIDHSISYNNAAYFATAPIGLDSTRGSEISRIDAHDLFRPPPYHNSGSLQSEV